MGPSLVLDLGWAAHSAVFEDLRSAHPVLGRLYAERPGLEARVVAFWADEPTCFPELQVLAHLAGALELTDFPTVQVSLEQALAVPLPDLALTSETPRDRSVILSRLDELARSPARRHAYFELLGEFWADLEPWWRAEGIPAVERRAAGVRRDLDRGSDWRQLVGPGCDVFSTHLPEIGARHQRGQAIALAPCALFGKGLYLDLPGCTLVGIPAGRVDVAARARTDKIARRLRVVADPTRLAVLDHLAAGPSSVGEIARAFSLAQPTVSAHVKHLREAGLVRADRRGTRLEVSVDRAALAALAGELAALIGR
jgi:ArsR family transcriptional regulator